jgi:hypothetical protein
MSSAGPPRTLLCSGKKFFYFYFYHLNTLSLAIALYSIEFGIQVTAFVQGGSTVTPSCLQTFGWLSSGYQKPWKKDYMECL